MVQVQVTEGILEGEEVQNEYGGTFYSFKGIPYAQPPIGDLRFKVAQPVQPWTGVRKATKFGAMCYQYDVWEPNEVREEPDYTMSEDCLYLNIYTPDISPRRLLPVMFYVHGGGHVCGSGNDDYYGPQFLIRHGVLLVTFNYRLEVLGFLCLHSADIPGNIGIKDQVAALRWLKENVGNFGGDPDNITIFGESSGALCVSYHLVSPMTKGLFRRAIIQSGAATSWTGEFGSRDKAILLAKRLGCFSEDDETLYNFFKKEPVEKLVNTKLKIWKSQNLDGYYFAVVSEKDFGQERYFYGDITDALRTGAHQGVEIMTGYTKHDGLVALGLGYSLEELLYEAKYFNEFFVPGWIKYHCVINDQLKVGSMIKRCYLKDKDFIDERDQLIKFFTTDLFIYSIILLAKFLTRNNKVYLYKFTCTTERNIFARVDLPEPIEDRDVVAHGDDLSYLFPLRILFGKVDEKSEEFKAINRVTKLWTNFAKYGNPTPNPDDEELGVEWKPYSIEKQECLDIGNTLTMGTLPEKEEIEYWENIFREYLPKYTL